MPVFVSKFGGTSLSDGERFQNVFNIVRENPGRQLIVLSAPGKRGKGDSKITDLLLKCEEDKDRNVFSRIRKRFMEISECTGVSIKEALDEAEEAIFSGASRAYCASRGEYLSALIFSGMSGFSFLDARNAVFFQNGKIDEDKTKNAIEAAFRMQNRLVIPGFYGSDEDGSIRLFPRGGSDTTGAIAAFSISADAYENWTDVDGMFGKDPNLHQNQTPIFSLSYDEAERILKGGAAVLHPDCLYWARKKGTPILIKNSFRPSVPGTRIGGEAMNGG